MKFNKLLLLAPVALLSLTSCGRQVRYQEKDYVLSYYDAKDAKTVVSNENFNILQLSDIHFTYLADNQYHFKFIKKTIDAAKAILENEGGLHLIVITGDTFTFATKETIMECCAFFESQGVPWTITFGNHDEQGYFSVDWMTNYLTALSDRTDTNLLFVDHPNDDVFGSANFVINLHDDGVAHLDDHRQIVIMDSNRYNYGEGMGYDYIHTDQIDWYERMYHYFVNKGDSTPVSLAFFHIPLPEYTDAYNKAKDADFDKSDVYNAAETPTITENQKPRKTRGEDESSPEINSHFLDRIENCDWYTRGIFVGHDHINNYSVNYDKDGDNTKDIKFNYGIKATNTVYYDEAYLGGQIIHFANISNNDYDPSTKITTDLILHKYSDLEVK